MNLWFQHVRWGIDLMMTKDNKFSSQQRLAMKSYHDSTFLGNKETLDRGAKSQQLLPSESSDCPPRAEQS